MIKLCNLWFVIDQDDHWPRWPSFVISNFSGWPHFATHPTSSRQSSVTSSLKCCSFSISSSTSGFHLFLFWHHLQLQVFIYYFFDIIFNFWIRMTFVNERGEVVEAGKDIALHYVKGKIELELHISGNPYNPKVGSCRTWSQLFRLTCSTQPAPSTTWWATTTTWWALGGSCVPSLCTRLSGKGS